MDAAGRCTGSRYEVVNNGACTRYKPTAPYANDSFEWAHSVRHLHGSTARGVVGWKSPTEKELTCWIPSGSKPCRRHQCRGTSGQRRPFEEKDRRRSLAVFQRKNIGGCGQFGRS